MGVEPVRELGHGAHPPDPYLNGPVLMAGDDVPLATGSLRPHRHGRGPGVERKRAPGRTGAAPGRACRGRRRGRGPRGPGRRPGPPPGHPPARSGRWRSPAGRSRRRAAGQCARNRPGCRRSSTHGRPRGAPAGPAARRNALRPGPHRGTRCGPGPSPDSSPAGRVRAAAPTSGSLLRAPGRSARPAAGGRQKALEDRSRRGRLPQHSTTCPSAAVQGATGRTSDPEAPPATVEVAERPWETASQGWTPHRRHGRLKAAAARSSGPGSEEQPWRTATRTRRTSAGTSTRR